MDLHFVVNLIFAMACGAFLNRARGDGIIPRIAFALILSWILTQGLNFPHMIIVAAGLWLVWWQGWGCYLGEIVHPGVWEREKEEPITDWIMKNFFNDLPDQAWGVVATSVRFSVYSIPLFMYLQNPLWPAMLMTGPLYLLGHYIDERVDEHDPVNRDVNNGWTYGEYIVGAWIVYLLLMWGHA